MLLFTIRLSSCKKIPVTVNNNYDRSYAQWLSFKRAAKNGYTFTITTSSFAGFNTETKITVINNAIAARDFTSFNYVRDPANSNLLKKVVVDQWHEDKTSLNRHGDRTWFLTMDEVYVRAKQWLSADPKKNTTYFETKNDGLISTAGYVPIGCEDDCFTGITIS